MLDDQSRPNIAWIWKAMFDLYGASNWCSSCIEKQCAHLHGTGKLVKRDNLEQWNNPEKWLPTHRSRRKNFEPVTGDYISLKLPNPFVCPSPPMPLFYVQRFRISFRLDPIETKIERVRNFSINLWKKLHVYINQLSNRWRVSDTSVFVWNHPDTLEVKHLNGYGSFYIEGDRVALQYCAAVDRDVRWRGDLKAGIVELFQVVSDLSRMTLIKNIDQRNYERSWLWSNYIYTVDIASPFWPLSCQRASSFPIHKPVLAPVIYHAVFRIYLSCALMWWRNSSSHNRVWVWRPVFSAHVEDWINALMGGRRSTSISRAYYIEHTSRRTKWVSLLDPFVDTNDTYFGSHEEKASSVPGCSNIVVYLAKWHTFYITCTRLHAQKRGVMFVLI